MSFGLRDRTGSSINFSMPWFSQNSNGSAGPSGVLQSFSNFEIIDSSHSDWSAGNGDQGGPLYLKKEETHYVPAVVNRHWGSGALSFSGGIVPGGFAGSIPDTGVTIAKASDGDLDYVGTKLLSDAIPTNPTFDLAAFIGELRQPGGVPHVVGLQTLRERARYLRNSGDEYLNVEFGWKPMISDLRSFAYAVKKSKSILDQYQKDAGRKIRRRKGLPTTGGSLQVAGSFYCLPSFYNAFLPGTLYRTDTAETWFSGAFKYFLPADDTLAGKMNAWADKANHLLGLRLTPDVLWELAPWSWAADWFGNTGTLMKNISRFGHDGLVMQYGYVMHHSERNDRFEAIVDWYDYQQTGLHYQTPCSATYKLSYKQRRPATPYGFGYDMSALTGSQTAILAALGLSHIG